MSANCYFGLLQFAYLAAIAVFGWLAGGWCWFGVKEKYC